MDQLVLDFQKYRETARQTVAEGQVLLRNEKQTLPFAKGSQIAVFGRMQLHYYKSGTGSGGMVNVEKVTGILDALLEKEDIQVNQRLLQVYRSWEETHPIDEGLGWGQEPWSQEEMPLTKELAEQAAGESDYALVVIARTAGEDRDNQNMPGAYLLTEAEENMLALVRECFEKMVVVLNVGNIMDMSFVDRYLPEAVLYAWQGGMIGGLGTVDVLTGAVTPSGRLADTIARRLEDYPSHLNFGDGVLDFYQEDIYVGYRYFETAAREAVWYPFGYGLSYTTFTIQVTELDVQEEQFRLAVEVTNTGTFSGKEVVQVYVQAPQGRLGKPARVLAAYAKTKCLEPGEKQFLSVKVPFHTFASYDEVGVCGQPSAFVLEAGEYGIYVGSHVRAAVSCGEMIIRQDKVIEQCSQALAPVRAFQRMKPERCGGQSAKAAEAEGCAGAKTEACGDAAQMQMYRMEYEDVPLRGMSPAEKRLCHLPQEIPVTGDKGYLLSDVKSGKISMEAFIAQFSDEDLACIIRGEGMGSPRVTPGTASAFGGVSESLKKKGIPCGCCDDGPSGMRLDSGMKAFSLPNGTLMACTFNDELVEELYAFTGVEMVKNQVDNLLGPGMNIHRHPLNGRNFEYFSEDPLLTGKMAAAQLRGLHRSGVTGTIKHFCANNRELRRHDLDSVVSERALREIYLKGFEIAVKEGGADSVMTTYGSVNGLWTAGSYDLNTTILRGEWGFTGIVMTDWWAQINEEGVPANKTNFAAMAKAQNDLYMVCAESENNSAGDNTIEALRDGTLKRAELQRNAMNICRFLLHTHAYERMNGRSVRVEVTGDLGQAIAKEQEIHYYQMAKEIVIDLEAVKSDKGSEFVFELDLEKLGVYQAELTASSELGELAQLPVTLFYQSVPFATYTFNGTKGTWVTQVREVPLSNQYALMRLSFGQNGLRAKSIRFTYLRELDS